MKKLMMCLLVAMVTTGSMFSQENAVDSVALAQWQEYGLQIEQDCAELDSIGLTTMSKQLKEYADTIQVDENSNESIQAGILAMQTLLKDLAANKASYKQFPLLIAENDSLVKSRPFPLVAEDLGQKYASVLDSANYMLANVASARWNSYIEYADTLKAQKHNWHIHAEDPTQWKFNLNTTIDNNFVVSLDTSRNIAQIKQIRGTLRKVDTIPSYIPYKGELHAPVILGDGSSNGLYTNSSKKDSLKVVKLPNTLKVIENNAFKDCAKMDSLVIPPYTNTIGSNVFQGCEELTELTIEAKVPPVLKGSLYKVAIVYVPENTGDAYWESTYWGDCAVVPGDGIRLMVDLKEPGTLGKLILEKVSYLRDVNFLKITGNLSTEDAQILGRLKGLISIDMSELPLSVLPERMFYQRGALKTVILPQQVESLTIGKEAFAQCGNLRNISFPERLKDLTLNTMAFYYSANIKEIHFPEYVENLTIGASAFKCSSSNRSSLSKIHFPKEVKSIKIESDAFYYCISLKEIQFPWEVETLIIWDCGFKECINLTSIYFPKKMKQLDMIGASSSTWATFVGCSSLRTVVFPEEVEELTIGSWVFYNCSNLTEITFPEEVEELTLEHSVFCYCSNLTEITFPAGLRSLGTDAFKGCTNLKKVVCKELLPPTIPSGSSLGAPDNCALYVPSWTLNDYKLAAGWTEFYPILPMETLPEKLVVDRDFSLELPEQLPANYHPDMRIEPSKALRINGDANWHLDDFAMSYVAKYAYNNDANEKSSQLLNESVLSADSVTLKLRMKYAQWNFISLPFDAAVKDIVVNDPQVAWVIRRYAGENRAQQLFGQTWVDVSIEDTLYAGNGYIWQCSYGSSSTIDGWYYDKIFTIPAVKNEHLNGIFANGNVKYALQAYPAELLNNQGWNLVGNPYPSYYDSRAMRFESPITVWNASSKLYEAYSLQDDAYILTPGEAFFVQCPPMDNALEFRSEGRQLYDTARVSADYLVKAGTRAAADRKLFNLILSDGEQSDRARVVINPKASASYEMHCDAGKFMSDDNAALQCYTLSEGVQYAINEMPLPNEEALCFAAYFPAKSDYSISLDTKVDDMTIVLFDKKLGTQTDLSASSYHFTADAGYDMSRFTLFFQAKQENKPTHMDEMPIANVDVFAHASGLSVNASQSVLVQVYAVDGSLLQAAEGAQHSFNLPAGTYMVKVQQKVYKVAVL